MSWKQHFIYWVFPLVFICALSYGYFAGKSWLQDFIALPANREFGFQEHVEHLLLLVIVVMTILVTIRVRKRVLKLIFFICIAGSVFLFLEEIDYGYHYYNYLVNGVIFDPVSHNFHNQEKHTINNMMKICYLIMAAFIILPYIRPEKLPPWLQFLTPSSRLQFTILVLPLTGRFPLWLNTMGYKTNGSLHDNLSEFEELGIYYIFLLYFSEMFRKAKRREDRGTAEVELKTAE